MKKAIFEKAGKMSVVEAPMPTIEKDDDVIIKVVRTCVCGSDLWAYSAGDAKKTLVTKLSGSLKKWGRLLLRLRRVTL